MKYPLLTALLLVAFLPTFSQTKGITGFSKEKAAAQLKSEETYDSYLKTANIDQWIKTLSARPHHLGSPYGKKDAEFIRDLFKSWGYDAKLETYQVLFPTPKVRLLELTGPTKFKAGL